MCVLEKAKRCLAGSSPKEDVSGQPNQPLHSHPGSPWGYMGPSKVSRHHPGAVVMTVLAASTRGRSRTWSSSQSPAAGQEAHSYVLHLLCNTFPGSGTRQTGSAGEGGHQVHMPRPTLGSPTV